MVGKWSRSLLQGVNSVLPKTKSIELPLLRVINDSGGELKPEEAILLVEDFFPELTAEDKRRLNQSGQNQWKNRVQWARQSLVIKGYMPREPYGVWRITLEGVRFLEEHWASWKPEYSTGGTVQREKKPFRAKQQQFQQPSLEEARTDHGPPTEEISGQREIRLHEQIKEYLVEIGNILGKQVHKEYREPPHIYDVVWKEFEGAPRASHALEVQDRGNLIEALAKLQHARDIWGSVPILVVTGERDREKAEHLVRPLLAGTFHRLAAHLVVLTAEQVVRLYNSLRENKEIISKFLLG